MTNNFALYKKLLAQFVSLRSVSTDPSYKGEIEHTVSWLQKLFNENYFKTKILRGKNFNPVVLASLNVSPKLETVLIYGHYDVQPAKKSDGWKGEPFSLIENSKKLFGRGIVDNKGQVLAHMLTSFVLAKTKKLNYNVKFLIEGNEETANEDLADLMRKNKGFLKCDFVLVSDGELTNDKPTIEVSLRGGFNCTLSYTTGKNNLHSGLVGGAVPNAAQELARFLALLFTSQNSISFKEFYGDMDRISKKEFSNNQYLARTGKSLPDLFGVQTLLTQKGTDFFTQTGLMPTIQITGIKAGYIDTGYANIVPGTAEVRLNFRIVASQKPEKVRKVFEQFVARNTPKYVDYKLSYVGLHTPVKINIENAYVKNAGNILKAVYKTHINNRNVGGAVPFVADVKEILGVDTLLIPLANEDCNMHGVNENFDIALVKKALEFSREFLSRK